MILLGLIPWYVRWVVFLAAAGVLWGHGYTTGLTHESDRRDALAQAQFKTAVERGNKLSGTLAARNVATNSKTQEGLQNVPKVTTGRKCLDAGAIRLLNDTPAPRMSAAPWKPADPPPAAAASDRDIAGWAIRARGQYKLVADQLNALIDYVEGKEPNPEDEEIEP